MKFGCNSVLFGGYDMATAFRCIAEAGYEGIELSAIGGMSEHLVLERWRELTPEVNRLKSEYALELLAMEQPSQDRQLMEEAFRAAAELGIPVVNCGPGGKSGDEDGLRACIDSLGELSRLGEQYGVTLCVKAHVGAAIFNTPTTLAAIEAIRSPCFGVDMDPSHIYRAGEDPVEALQAVIGHVRHVHIRDCRGRQQGPGKPEEQANGRGEINLSGYLQVLLDSEYSGPVDLEVIGAKEYPLERCCAIAAESRGHMRGCIQTLQRPTETGKEGR